MKEKVITMASTPTPIKTGLTSQSCTGAGYACRQLAINMKKQPDFKKLFYDHFGSTPQKVTYSVRSDSNRFHDMVFLSSLIHDSRFKIEEMRQRGKKIIIPINRDCWEIPRVRYEKPSPHSELHIANAQLTIAPVLGITWTYRHGIKFSNKSELWIQNIWLNRQDNEEMGTLALNGFDWNCALIVNTDDLVIKLQDLEIPYLYSQKHKRKTRKS